MAILTWAETKQRLRDDRARLRTFLDPHPGRRPIGLTLNPSYVCVALQRLSHYLFVNGHRLTARLLWHVNLLITGADMPPSSDIGGGFVVDHPVGSGVIGKIGRNCTLRLAAGVGGGGADQSDIGGGPGLPVIGDDVELGAGALIVGPIRIGNRVRVGARCLITRSVPDDTVVEAAEPRQVPRQ
jgi:serine O-acetyltransferase